MQLFQSTIKFNLNSIHFDTFRQEAPSMRLFLISKKSLINSDHGAAEFFHVEQLFEAIQLRQFFNFSLPNGQDYSVFIAA